MYRFLLKHVTYMAVKSVANESKYVKESFCFLKVVWSHNDAVEIA